MKKEPNLGSYSGGDQKVKTGSYFLLPVDFLPRVAPR